MELITILSAALLSPLDTSQIVFLHNFFFFNFGHSGLFIFAFSVSNYLTLDRFLCLLLSRLTVMQIAEFSPVSFGAITLTIICISSLQIFKSCSLLTYILFSAHRAPWWVLTKKTMAKPPAKRRTGRMDKLKCRNRKTTIVMSLAFFATIYSAIMSGTALVLKPRAFFLWDNTAKHTALLSLVWVYFSGQWPSVDSDLIFTEEKKTTLADQIIIT